MRDEAKIGDKAVIDIMKGIRDEVIGRGVAEILTIGPDGKVKQKTVVHNQVLLVGDAHVADQMSDAGEAAMGWMAFGTTSGGKTEADTVLENETNRGALDSGPTQGIGANDNDVVYVGSLTGVALTMVEAGLFNNAVADTGTMLCYTEFSHVLTAPDTLQITWTVSFGH